MAAGRCAGRARFRRHHAGGAEGKRSSRDRTARPDVRQFDRGHGKWIARRSRSAYPWSGGGRALEPRRNGREPPAGGKMTSLKGKTLFISGGSRGIGLAIALRAARDGANVAIAA